MRRLWIALGALVALLVGVSALGWIALQRIDWNEYKEPVAAAALDATGRRLDLAGDLDLQIGLSPGVWIERVAFENAGWGSRPQMVTAERIVVRLELIPLFFGDVVVDRIELIGLDVLLETGEDGVGNWEFAGAGSSAGTAEPQEEQQEEDGAPASSEPLSALVRETRIENAVIVIRDPNGGEQRFAVRRLLAQMEGDALTLDLEAEYGRAPVALRGSITGVSELLAGGALGLDLEVEAGGARVDCQGQVAVPLDGTGLDLALNAAGERLRALGPLVDSELPDLGPYSLALVLRGGGAAYEISDLALGMGTSKIQGDLSVDLAGARPRLEAKLHSSGIDAADFQDASEAPPAAGNTPPSGEATTRSDKVFPSEPLPLDGLAAADVSLLLAVDRLVADGIELANLKSTVVLDDRRLRIDGLGGELAGGRFDLDVILDGSRPAASLSVSAKVRGVDAGQLAKAQGSDVVTGGPVDVDLQVAGRGESVAKIMASLGGDLEVRMGPAVVDNEWAGVALSDVKSTLGKAGAGSGAEVACVLADFGITDGVARPEALVADLGAIALFGEGKVDLGKEKIKLSFDRQAQALSASGVLPPFKLKGTFASPKVGIDAAAAAGRAVDFGAALLSGKKQGNASSPSGLGCRELYAGYMEAKAKRGSSADVAIDAISRLGGKGKNADDDEKAEKRIRKAFKGLLGR